MSSIVIGTSLLLFIGGCFQLFSDRKTQSRNTPIKHGIGHQITRAEVENLQRIYGRKMKIGSISMAEMTTNEEAIQANRDLRVNLTFETQDFEMGLSQSGKVIYWVEKGIECIRPSFARSMLPIMVVLLMPILATSAIMELIKARRMSNLTQQSEEWQ
jgi:hypothetical protein